ncbi:MAG: thioesterase family protein [Pseudomonadota bacterium]
MDFSQLMGSGSWDGEAYSVEVPDTWLQGRTAYGGLASAICAEAAARLVPDLPPLRSVQVAFLGPSGGAVRAVPQVVRQGKSATFVSVDLLNEGGLATRTLFVFGKARESELTFVDHPFPDVPKPEDLKDDEPNPMKPGFLANFDVRTAGGMLPFSATDETTILWWGRHKERVADETELRVLTLGDLTPPGTLPMMKTLAPVSSVNWHFDLLTEDLSTEDGWYLLSTRAQSAGGGWSAQDMAMWTSDGRPVAAGRQLVAIFA